MKNDKKNQEDNESKTFIYNQILAAEDICNLKREKNLIAKAIRENKKIVLYGGRNCGKTSLIKSVIIPHYQKEFRDHFVMVVDFMQVRDLYSLAQRTAIAFNMAFAESFKGENFLASVKKMFIGLRPRITLDPNTGEPGISLEYSADLPFSPHQELQSIFSIIKKKIVPQKRTLIVFDEFQDVHSVPEAEGILRPLLESLDKCSVILMGSKKHLLSKIVGNPDSPLASYGYDIEFEPIPYEEYHQYIQERFVAKSIKIPKDICISLQDMLNRIPESINMVCGELSDLFSHKTLAANDLHVAMNSIVNRRQTRFEEQLASLSKNEESILIQLAFAQPVKAVTSADFLSRVKLNHRTVSLTVKHLEHRSILEKRSNGYHLVDPLLRHYLMKYRIA